MVKTPEIQHRHRFPQSIRACMTADTIGVSTGPQIRNRTPVVNSISTTPGDIGEAVIGAATVGTSKLTMQTAERRAVTGASETAGSQVFRRRERPPTQLHQAPSRLQRCAPSRLSTIFGAAEPKSLSRLLPNNGEMEPTKIAPSSPGHCTFTRVRPNHSSPEATLKPLFLLCTCSISAKIS
jgi:hypothetical protein